jgi:hypothetical protein
MIKIESKKNKKQKKMEYVKKYPNGQALLNAMNLSKIKGDVRDYVLITRTVMIDYRGSYKLNDRTDDRLVILHKRNLKNVIGEESAKRFWLEPYGRIVDIKEAKKK